MDPGTPVEDAFEWATQPHPELIDVAAQEVVTGWRAITAMDMWGAYFPMSILLTMMFIVGVAYCALRIRQIRALERAQFQAHAQPVIAQDVSRTQLRWQRVMEHANSPDEHQWRLAILEADIMLNDLLDMLGYRGETMADKLKQVNRAQFNSIDGAWEAHRVRNRVAHESAEHPLTEREKNQVIGMFASVFREFNLIP